MKLRSYRWLVTTVALSMLVVACVPVTPLASKTQGTGMVANSEQPYKIIGSFTVTNDFVIATYMVEHAVALVDMHGFVIRDQEWEVPVDSQVLGYMKVDTQDKSGTYELDLPLQPQGTFDDVDNNGQTDAGVQVFSVAYWPNLAGGPFSVADDPSFGWPTYLASVKTDTENNDEVIGGSLVVWSPDDKQQFPTGFGPDGMLFTTDDPEGPIPAGYSIVNLDTQPFSVSQQTMPNLTLYEPQDVALKDYSNLSYTEAFDKMFEIVRKEYAFNDVPGKAPDWDTLYSQIKPRIEAADQNKDAQAFYLALRDFTWAFKDGHVGMSSAIGSQLFQQAVAGGYGFAIRELDDGSVRVVFVLDGGPAAQAGMQVGATVTECNGKSIEDAISDVKPWAAPFSTETSRRYQQARYLLRAAPGTQATVTFANPQGASQTAALTAITETQSFSYTSVFRGFDPNALPVEFKILNSGVGYIKINSNYDDLNLIIRLFERALKTFQANQVPGIIIDLRQNSGGNPLGLAGFLYDQDIPEGQLEYYSDKTGKFEPEGPREKVRPMVEQYHFDKEVLLVDQGCASACEIEAYGFSQVPGMIVVGQYPTAGVEAEVARGQFKLPEDITLQVPTGRFKLPDGGIFLEGKGVQPTERVPIDESTVLSSQDEVLKAGEQAALKPLGQGITPSGPPRIASQAEAQQVLSSGMAKQLEDLARETYSSVELDQAGKTFTYTVPLSTSQELAWAWGWCAASQATLEDNLKHIQLDFTLEDQDVPLDQFAKLDYQSGGQSCRAYVSVLTDWPGGEHHLSTTVVFDQTINDGSTDYLAGKQVREYTVYVNP